MRDTLKTWISTHRTLSVLIAALALVLVAVGLRLTTPSTPDVTHAAAPSAAPSAAPNESDGPAAAAT